MKTSEFKHAFVIASQQMNTLQLADRAWRSTRQAHLYSQTDIPMRSQSLTTPAMFIVRAEVFPISRKTDMFSAAVQHIYIGSGNPNET